MHTRHLSCRDSTGGGANARSASPAPSPPRARCPESACADEEEEDVAGVSPLSGIKDCGGGNSGSPLSESRGRSPLSEEEGNGGSEGGRSPRSAVREEDLLSESRIGSSPHSAAGGSLLSKSREGSSPRGSDAEEEEEEDDEEVEVTGGTPRAWRRV